MKLKIFIVSSAITALSFAVIIGLSSFTDEKDSRQYLSLTANMYGNSYEIHIIDETGELEKIELPGTAGRRNNIEWKKFVWKKVNEISRSGYKLVLGRDDISADGNDTPRCNYIFEKDE